MRDEVSGHEPADFGDVYRFWRKESSIDTARGMKVDLLVSSVAGV